MLGVAAARSPLRLLMPRNHGDAAWVFLATLGGGLVDGDVLDVRIDADAETTGLVGTQASTKVYRSPKGCSQRFEVHVADGAALAMIPDPVVCFAGARYHQSIDISLAPTASLVLLDGYTCGRSARGERWQFDHFESKTTIARDGSPLIIDATLLDPAHGPIAERMGRFEAMASLFVIGPRFAGVRDAMLAPRAMSSFLRPLSRSARACGTPSLRPLSAAAGDPAVVAASPVGVDAAIVRVAAHGFEHASRALRGSFAALGLALGDDPFARKW